MNKSLKLLCVLAHPDDESLGTGSTLAKYADQGIETYLVCATKGQKGWKLGDYPGPEAVGEHRARELQKAAEALKLKKVCFLDYMDGELDQVDPQEAISKIANHIKQIQPQVVITFGPEGMYGHPDHIAISQFTAAAIVQAANQNNDGLNPHQVLKFYYLVWSRAQIERYQSVFGDLKSKVDDNERRFAGWDDWALTTELETSSYVADVKEAINCHQSQLRSYQKLLDLSEEMWQKIYGQQTYYRALSLVNGGRKTEDDLFEGIR